MSICGCTQWKEPEVPKTPNWRKQSALFFHFAKRLHLCASYISHIQRWTIKQCLRPPSVYDAGPFFMANFTHILIPYTCFRQFLTLSRALHREERFIEDMDEEIDAQYGKKPDSDATMHTDTFEVENSAAKPKPSKQIHGSRLGNGNYSHEDKTMLLDIVKKHEPYGSNHWDRVQSDYHRWASASQRPRRTVDSLQHKFDKLVYKRKKTGYPSFSELVRSLYVEQNGFRGISGTISYLLILAILLKRSRCSKLIGRWK